MVAEQYDEHGIMLDRLEDELPDPELSQDELPDPDPNTNSSANKRRKVGINKPRKPWAWKKEDLPHNTLPENSVKPKNLEDCNTDVQYFLKMFGEDNIKLITEETNWVRCQSSISINKSILYITQCEIRQCLGNMMYMSV